MTDDQGTKIKLLGLMEGEKRDLTPEEREFIAGDIAAFLAEECDLSPEQVHGSDLLQDLGVDSLTFLELFEELRSQYNFDVETRAVARYARDNPVLTVDDLVEQICLFLEGKIDLTSDEPGSAGAPAAGSGSGLSH